MPSKSFKPTIRDSWSGNSAFIGGGYRNECKCTTQELWLRRTHEMHVYVHAQHTMLSCCCTVNYNLQHKSKSVML